MSQATGEQVAESRKRRGRNARGRWLGAALAALLGCAYWVFGLVQGWHEIERGAQLTRNVDAVQLTLERYALAHGKAYPATLGQMVEEGFIQSLPLNPYTHKPGPEIPPGEAPQLGGLAYCVAADPERTDGYRQSYELIVYGKNEDPLPYFVQRWLKPDLRSPWKALRGVKGPAPELLK